MFQKILPVALLLWFCFIFSACCHRSGQAENVNSDECPAVNSMETDPALQESIRLCKQLLDGIQHKNTAMYEDLFYPAIQKELDENGFYESCRKVEEQFGKITGYSYVCSLKYPLMHNLVWRVDFQNRDKDNTPVEYQLLFRVLLGKIEDRYEILGMGFL